MANLIELGASFFIEEHATLSADVNLATINLRSRSVEDAFFPGFFGEQEGNLFSLGGDTRSVEDKETAMLELSDIENAESVTVDNPVKLYIKQPLAENEVLIPITFDGDVVLPIGTCDTTADGQTVINIEEIPDIETGSRSVKRALKMCFYKLVMGKKDNQKLCWNSFDVHGKVVYHDDVAEKVKTAKNILIVTHGIIGSSIELVRAVKPLFKKEAPKYDLLLSFDYENLNTPIDETARILKKLLKEANVGQVEGQKITLAAHSMGGLVARHFIEKEGGNQMIDRLILAGTPSKGSNLAKVTKYRDWAITMTTFGIKFGLALPALVVVGLKGSQKITATLEQMKPSSDFIKNLNEADDPKIPYTILAGALSRYYQKNPVNEFKEKALDRIAKLFYGTASNDMVVATTSIMGVPENRQFPVNYIEVDCHHFNHFEENGGLSAFVGVL